MNVLQIKFGNDVWNKFWENSYQMGCKRFIFAKYMMLYDCLDKYSTLRSVWFLLFLSLEITLCFHSANSLDPDRTLSDLGLQSLSMSQLWHTRLPAFIINTV